MPSYSKILNLCQSAVLFVATPALLSNCKPTQDQPIEVNRQVANPGQPAVASPTPTPQGNSGTLPTPTPPATGTTGTIGNVPGGGNNTNTTPTPTPTPTPGPPSYLTLGSGGQIGFQELRSPGGATYQINAPQDNSPQGANHGLLILLHGSSASSYDRFVNEMAQVASANRLIPVSVLAPNGRGWNEGDQNSHARYLHDLVSGHLYSQYNIDKRNVFFSGQSSGAGFLASHFVALYGNEYSGGAFMQCGGAPPANNISLTPEFKANFQMHFEITTNDGIWENFIYNAEATYRQAGATVTLTDTKPGGHCQFDQAQVIVDHIGSMITR